MQSCVYHKFLLPAAMWPGVGLSSILVSVSCRYKIRKLGQPIPKATSNSGIRWFLEVKDHTGVDAELHKGVCLSFLRATCFALLCVSVIKTL